MTARLPLAHNAVMNKENIFVGQGIRLCAIEPKDAETMARWTEDATYLRDMDSSNAKPRSVASYREELGSGSKRDALEFGIRATDGNKLIGFVNLFGVSWKNRSCLTVIGIGDPECRGKGHGTEAVRMILRYAFGELNMNRVGLSVYANNKAAIRCYEKNGFKCEGVEREAALRDGRKIDSLYMGILHAEWAQSFPIEV